MTNIPVFSSALASDFHRYVELKCALGRQFALGSRVLHSLDQFLSDPTQTYSDLTDEAFQEWCRTQENVSHGVRRFRMRTVHHFCVYRRRTEPECFVPDPSSFPLPHQPIRPYIFSEREIARLLAASFRLPRLPSSPLRPEVIRLAVALLFTTGMRRGELLRLTVGDYDAKQATLLIRESKFRKSRVLPLHQDVSNEIESYLRTRRQLHLPVSADTPLIWNRVRDGRPYTGTGLRGTLKILLKDCRIRTANGQLPRIHDFRHAFAANALIRWYRTGVDVSSKLPLLATYLGHVSVVSTHYYLRFVEPLRTLASKRFANHWGGLVTPLPKEVRR